jgi:hypothetical protein
MTKQFRLIAFATCLAAIPSLGMPTAQAKQQCSAEVPSNSHGYWSWRLIDGEKCWYEGKPMLAKSALEWPKKAPVQPDSHEQAESVRKEKPSDPMDSNAWVPESDSFEALWRARVNRN